MKKIYAFCTRLRVYWVLLPIIFLLTICIIHNEKSEGALKLYPLIALCSLAIIFTLVFLFRMVEISYSEIRHIGLFSERDKVIITEGKKIVLRRGKGGITIVELVGNNGRHAELDWLKNSNEPVRDIVMFSAKAAGGRFVMKRILRYFGADEECLSTLSDEGQNGVWDYENTRIERCDFDDTYQYVILIKKTI